MAVLDLPFSARAFSSCGKRGPHVYNIYTQIYRLVCILYIVLTHILQTHAHINMCIHIYNIYTHIYKLIGLYIFSIFAYIVLF